MKISVKVKPNSKEEKVEKIGAGNFRLCVKAAAKENKANEAVLALLSKYFDTPKSMITIIKGKSAKNKVFNIEAR